VPDPLPQQVLAPLTPTAIFLVATIDDGGEEAVHDALADVSGLVRAIGFRDPTKHLSVVTSIGSDAWDRLFAGPRPAELHPFIPLDGPRHHAPSTPGDLLFHIRAEFLDVCFELAGKLVDALGAVTVIDEVHGFKFFDNRDLMGFVDGTENPDGPVAASATQIGDEDPDFAGGCYVHVQPNSHLALNVIEDDQGNELKILRHNMPFGEVGKAEFGTYYIGYSRSAAVTERMLRNMFIGDPPGNTDRILDFSTAATGTMFFTPTADFLDDPPPLPGAAAEADEPTAAPPAPSYAGSLSIGSLKGQTQ
jgi:putative iron-dependent peroxidase